MALPSTSAVTMALLSPTAALRLPTAALSVANHHSPPVANRCPGDLCQRAIASELDVPSLLGSTCHRFWARRAMATQHPKVRRSAWTMELVANTLLYTLLPAAWRNGNASDYDVLFVLSTKNGP
ncbi:hypothetical protein GGF50DRAFT_120787 [Schizophyllum commune]